MFAARHCVRLGQSSLRRFTTNRALKTEHEGFRKLKANQELFQKEDLIEDVYVKKGVSDQLTYRIVVALTFLGLALSGKTAYDLATGTF